MLEVKPNNLNKLIRRSRTKPVSPERSSPITPYIMVDPKMIDLGVHKIKPATSMLKRRKSDDSLRTVMTGLSKLSDISSGSSPGLLRNKNGNPMIKAVEE